MLCHGEVNPHHSHPVNHEQSAFLPTWLGGSGSQEPAAPKTDSVGAMKFMKCAKCVIGDGGYEIIRKECIQSKSWLNSMKFMNEDQLKCAQTKLNEQITKGNEFLKSVAEVCKPKMGCKHIIPDPDAGVVNSKSSTKDPAVPGNDNDASIDDLGSLVLLRNLTQLHSAASGRVFL
jgi:hypothetical protein